jgi:SAM-dependent MidA family methyltransferase
MAAPALTVMAALLALALVITPALTVLVQAMAATPVTVLMLASLAAPALTVPTAATHKADDCLAIMINANTVWFCISIDLLSNQKHSMLTEIIIDKIKTNGPVSFHDFMEMALYHPEHGYYTTLKKIGTEGDFYTSSDVTPVFGETIGRQLEEMWDYLGRQPFTIVEYGAGTGTLCIDILSYLKTNEELYSRLSYFIIEKSSSLRSKQRERCTDKVSWYNSIDELPQITGCIISNELVDNFSVHQVVMDTELMEVFVDHNGDFTEVLLPASDVIKQYLQELDIDLPPGFRTEVNLEATTWIESTAAKLNKGYLLTIDYGAESSDLYTPPRADGTVVCYNKHTVNCNPYQHIGEQDITAHVNFSALARWGEQNGLKCIGYTDQACFLLALGFKERLTARLLSAAKLEFADYKKYDFVLKKLIFEMGCKFKVLIQGKNTAPSSLTCLQMSNHIIS